MNHLDIDLNLLRVFHQVYLRRNVRRAAEALGLSQPAVSQALARLRHHLGDALFVRAAGGVAPTAKADHFARHVETALRTIDRGLDEADRFDPAHSQRRFLLHMNDLSEGEFLPALMAHLHQVAPGIRLQVAQVGSDQVLAALEQGRVELAVGYLPQLAGIHECWLYDDEFVLLTRDDHPITRRRAAPRAESLDYVVVQGYTDPERALQRQGLEANIRLQVPHFQVLPEILSRTQLAAMVPRAPAERFVRRYPLRIRTMSTALPPVRVSVHWIWRQHDDPGHQWLREQFVDLFAKTRQARHSP